MKAIRIHTGEHEGLWNMAFDRLLVNSLGKYGFTFVLRTYTWNPACVSIGRFQNVSKEVDRNRLLKDGYHLVRRPTGGRAVWHETELTYAIVAPEDHPMVSGETREALRKISVPLLMSMEKLGIPARANPVERHRMGGPRTVSNPCFTSHGLWEIGTSDGRKLVGNAQLRSRGMFLEHGSILIKNDQPKILRYLPDDPPPGNIEKLRILLEKGIANLREFNPGISFEDVRSALVESFSERLETELQEVDYHDFLGSEFEAMLERCSNEI